MPGSGSSLRSATSHCWTCCQLNQVQGAPHPYERVLMANGPAEYRDATNGSFEDALQPRDQAVSEELRTRKQAFGALADRFIERLRGTKLTGATVVALLYQCFDQQGNRFPPIRTPIIPQTTVRFSGSLTHLPADLA